VKVHKHRAMLSLPLMFLLQVAPARQETPAGSQTLITSPRPLVDASRRLQEIYGKVVTYEEPVLTWRGELEAVPGRRSLFPSTHSFVIPVESGPGTDLASVLENTIAAYHQQTSRTAFSYCLRHWVITLCQYRFTMRMDGLYRPPARSIRL
jgi:hypothetical protein